MKNTKNLLNLANQACTFQTAQKTRGVRITNKCVRVPICYYCNYMNEPVYTMTAQESVDRVTELRKIGVDRITLVSGWLGYQNTMAVPYLKALRKEFDDLEISAAAGPISKSSLKALKEAGLNQYGCNLEATPEILVKIKGFNDIPERIETLKNAREVGLKISTGYIMGIGENEEQLMRLLKIIRKVDPENVFMTPFEPYENTPMSEGTAPTIKQVAETVAKTRLMFKDKRLGLRIIRQGKFIPMEFLSLFVFVGINLVAPAPDITDMTAESFRKRLKASIQDLQKTEQNLITEGIAQKEIDEFKEIAKSLQT
ncbi:MAG: radical SAM protein [Candidatus Bathyarchaeota archaeon]|nr:radical SAM protein [Candidatus Bathyarchaeota archaeon]